MSGLIDSRARCVHVLALLALAFACAAGCAEPEDPAYSAFASRDFPKAGLFTPGSTIGYQAPLAAAGPDGGMGGLSDEELREIEDSIQVGLSGDRCVGSGDGEGTPGTLTVEFRTATYHGHYEPTNCGAVWIEDVSGQYIATPAIWAGIRMRNLFIWDARRCHQDVPDVITSATLDDHNTPHTATWDGRDLDGKVVPDGTYVLNVEVTEDEFNYGRRVEVQFDKGTEPVTLEPEDTESVKDLKLSYAPGS